MRAASLLTLLLQLKQTRVRRVFFDEEGLVAEVCPTTRVPRCGCCGCKTRRSSTPGAEGGGISTSLG